MISKEGLAVRFHEDQARPMGRDTTGVRGMNVAGKGNAVLSMDVARDEQEILVVTENGFGKRTAVSEYRKTSRGAKGVQTIKFSEKRGGLAAALVVRPHEELVFISENGMVQRTGVTGIRQTGRSAQGVTLMNVREDDHVSAVALIVESEADTDAPVEEGGPLEISADSGVELRPEEHAPGREAMLDDEVAEAADAALDEDPPDPAAL
jgi:DNA gyrase subunit A